ncbi:hypothetical protein FQS96_14150 [Enterococcus faecalis]|uniref:hypothetical protein n=1 Tax=Enterococcus TaxID=1350 RepID=UPI001A97C680|nr:hypothetical protein [Enterococcus faecalis]MBO1126579.1 hypothetical protein [Enterococcus faecalis]
MEYEELISTLYELARKTEDEEVQNSLLDLGWTVKKCGIRDESEDPNEEIHFKVLLYRLEELTEQAKDLADKIAINDLRNALASDGIDGYFGKFY